MYQTAVERSILEALSEVQLQLQHLTALVQSLQVQGRSQFTPEGPLPHEDLDVQLPLQSLGELDELEGKLNNAENKNKLVMKLTCVVCVYI